LTVPSPGGVQRLAALGRTRSFVSGDVPLDAAVVRVPMRPATWLRVRWFGHGPGADLGALLAVDALGETFTGRSCRASSSAKARPAPPSWRMPSWCTAGSRSRACAPMAASRGGEKSMRMGRGRSSTSVWRVECYSAALRSPG
jgi:hypothetical protein